MKEIKSLIMSTSLTKSNLIARLQKLKMEKTSINPSYLIQITETGAVQLVRLKVNLHEVKVHLLPKICVQQNVEIPLELVLNREMMEIPILVMDAFPPESLKINIHAQVDH